MLAPRLSILLLNTCLRELQHPNINWDKKGGVFKVLSNIKGEQICHNCRLVRTRTCVSISSVFDWWADRVEKSRSTPGGVTSGWPGGNRSLSITDHYGVYGRVRG